VTKRDLLEPSLAAGSILLRHSDRPLPLLAAAGVGHFALSLGWGIVLSATLPRRREWAWGALGGVTIAILDLGVVGRRFDRISALPPLPQVADHVAFGTIAGMTLARLRARRQEKSSSVPLGPRS
jgi:hypothetical protein